MSGSAITEFRAFTPEIHYSSCYVVFKCPECGSDEASVDHDGLSKCVCGARFKLTLTIEVSK